GVGTLLLAPRRTAAGRLRDALAVHGAGEARAMTPPALGHALVRADALRRGLGGEPTLVTGAEQDALLAELIAQREAWHLEVDPGARTLPGFRTELRDLITRAAELGLAPADLETLGQERARPAWLDAAALLRDYLGVLDLEASAALDAGPRLDSGALVRRAVRLLADPQTPLPFRAVVVDDAQDLTAAGIDLIAALRAAGARVMVCSSPDAAVDTFRGALPDAGDLLRELLPRPLTEVLLDGMDAQMDGLSAVVDTLRGRLLLEGSPAVYRRPGNIRRGGLVVLRAKDPLDEARLIGSALRDLHHREDVPYDEMAVVCSS